MLEAEEAKKSQLEAAQVNMKPQDLLEDVEMTHSPVKTQQLYEEDFENINMQSGYKPITIDVSEGEDELLDEEELRDEADEELFA